MAVSPVERPLFACLKTGKGYQRGGIPPFCKWFGKLTILNSSKEGGEEGFGLQRPYNYGLISKSSIQGERHNGEGGVSRKRTGEGKILYSDSFSMEWKFIIPESHGEFL